MSELRQTTAAHRSPTHLQAIGLMVLATLMWSIAGVITRHMQAAQGFEVTFWRSAFTFVALALALPALWWRQAQAGVGAPVVTRLTHTLRQRALWLSALCWAGMFTFFMLALTRTTVANVLITSAITPFITALLARGYLKQKIAPRTWLAIAACCVGIGYMYWEPLFGAQQAASKPGGGSSGIMLALLVPLSAACNWTVIQHQKLKHPQQQIDMVPAVMLGGLISALTILPASLPFAATARDLFWLAVLGVFQLAIPCSIVVIAQRVLKGPEVALLSLLEILFGVTWAWLFVHEVPSSAVFYGGGLVLAALIGNELAAYARQAD